MTDNIYVFENYTDQPAVTDDGTGTDWLVVTGTYASQFGHWGVQIYMFYEAPYQTNSWYFTFEGGITTSHWAMFNGQIENAQGGGGDEEIVGGAIANLLYGDALDVAGGNDALFGNAGADTLVGAGGSDWLHGGLDNDLMYGDEIQGEQGVVNIVIGDDSLFGDEGNDTVFGGWGNNSLSGDDGYDTLDYSGFFDDFGNTTYRIVAYAFAGTVVVYAKNTGDDTEVVAATDSIAGFEVIRGTSGDDRIEGDYTFDPGDYPGCELHGGAGRDTLYGTNGVDAIYGGEGEDYIADYGNTVPGLTGHDLLNGGNGNDYYTVQSATTVILETATGGHDYVSASFSYTLPANVEHLYISIFAGAASGTGNGLDNQLEGNGFANDLIGLGGNDYLLGFFGNDTLRGDTGADSAYGGNGNDQLIGLSQSDVLYGEAGADSLYGGSENDQLFGGTQADLLRGGLGRDVLRGGLGADTFSFAAAAETSGIGLRDVIADFTTGQDHIDLHLIALNQLFIGAANFHNIAKEIRYDAATGLLSGDTDGNGTANYAIVIGIGTALTGADLIL